MFSKQLDKLDKKIDSMDKEVMITSKVETTTTESPEVTAPTTFQATRATVF